MEAGLRRSIRFTMAGKEVVMHKLEHYCEKVQDSLMDCFWDDREGVFQNHTPIRKEENWVYWWHAHAIDCLLDGYLRTKDEKYLKRAEAEYNGVFRKNGNTFSHNWYDDMEWTALSILRFYDITGENKYKEQVLFLWEDIKTAWNDELGGMSWKKDQRDYRNTPANAPAAILAYRLYQRFSREEDLEWGDRILTWNLEHLMDPATGFIWDGMNREGDNKIDYEWKYTYNEGVVIGALAERYMLRKEPADLMLAARIAKVTKEEFTKGNHGIFPYEGEDDCGLFKGIYIRYLAQLIEEPEVDSEINSEMEKLIQENAGCLMERAINDRGLIGGCWDAREEQAVDLAQHLSGVMLLEMADRLSKGHVL